jgi:hypothetical protein
MTAMAHFFGWIVAELGLDALLALLARFSRNQWMIFLTALILLTIFAVGELSWGFAAVILSGAIALWSLLALLDLGLDRITRRHE